METNKNNPMQDGRRRDEELTNDEIVRNASEERIEENEQERRFHQQHGNRKYRMFSNHSSADDQPTTDTGTPSV